MARYPGAIWRPLTVDKSRWRLVPLRMNCHVAVSEAASLFGYFNGARSRPDSHFYVRRDGTIEQYVDTALVAYADLEGNGSTISIETQGGVTATQSEPWTAAQVESLAKLYAWAVRTHGIAVQIADDSKPGKSSHGLSWHRLGCDGNFPGRPLHGRVPGGRKYSRAFGKVCPGNAKIRQIPAVYSRAVALLGGAAAPASGPSARPDVEIQLALAVLDLYDAGPSLEYLDGDNGAHQRAAVQTYQRARGLLPDGWWGTNTDTYFREHDMSTVKDELATAVWGWIHGSEDYNMGFLVRRTFHQQAAVLGNQAGLLKAIEQLSTGGPIDLEAIKTAAEKGVADALAGLEADVTLNINTTQED